MRIGDKQEFFIFPFSGGHIWVSVYNFNDSYEVHASTGYVTCIERGNKKSECIERCLKRVKEKLKQK
ncbi:hypothetical protein ACLM5H_15840 [Fredinandcohnia humi]